VPGLHVAHNRDNHNPSSNQQAQDVSKVKLYLPSVISPSSNVFCDPWLRDVEWDLRQAQAQDALHELWDNLRLRSHVYIDNDRFQRGQRRNTRSRGLADRLEVKINAAAVKYRTAREAISALASRLDRVGWEASFPVLNDSDITALTDTSLSEYYKKRRTSQGGSSRKSRPSEGHRDISWIWKRLGSVDNEDEHLQDGMLPSLLFRVRI
jgi:hypothetical protein